MATDDTSNLKRVVKGLFQTGEFSDVQIICGNRTFQVHSAIICPQSPFFKAALKGHFIVCIGYLHAAEHGTAYNCSSTDQLVRNLVQESSIFPAMSQKP